MNQIQHRQKKVILFGAGAMIPLGGPTVSQLTKKILIHDSCKYVYQNIQRYYKDDCDFETLLSAVEFLLEWSFSNDFGEYISSQHTSILKCVFEKASAYRFKSKDELWKIYETIVNEIIEVIKDYDFYPMVTGCQKGEALVHLKDFIINNSNRSDCKIYTLNYDRLIPCIVGEEVDVYEGIENQRYSYDINKFVNHPLTHFNLHGSIYLHYDYTNGLMLKDNPLELEKPYLLSGGNPNEYKIFLPIIAGYHKSQRIMSEPFNFGVGAFMYDCNTCDELLVVGYSFRDPHINSILRAFLKISSIKITIIDYNSESVLPRSLSNRINRIFTSNYHFVLKSKGVYTNEHNNVTINMNGFNKFIEECINY